VIPQIFSRFSTLFAQLFHQAFKYAFRCGFPQGFRTDSGGKMGENRAVNEICGNRGNHFPQGGPERIQSVVERNVHTKCGTWNIFAAAQ